MDLTPAQDARSVHLLREAVLRHRESESRRRFPPRLHVGVPGGHTEMHEVSGHEDQALRTDLVAAMIEPHVRAPRGPAPHVYAWLTRPGHLSLHDLDVDWSVPVHEACAQAGLHGLFAVVTREGWWDPRTQTSARWVRLRRAPRAGHA
jgi:hypothetical protein